MTNLNNVTIADITDNFDNIRVPLSAKQRTNLNKKFPYYGAQSIIDYVDDYLFDGEYILVAEDGENLNSQKNNVCNLVNGKFWVNNHAHIIKAKQGHNTKYLYYKLNLINFKPFVTGSAQPKLTKDNLSSIPLRIHDRSSQNEIAKVLSDLDEKISLNNKINTELEAMVKLIYDYWFVQFDFPDANGKPYKSSGGKMVYNEELKREIPAGWKLEAVGEHLNIYDSNRIPMSRKERDAKQGPYPYFGATGVMDHVNDYIFDDDYILVAEDGSIMDESGMPIVQFIWGKTWVNNHAHVMQAKKKSQNEFYFQSLKRIPVVLIKTGSIQLKINQANLMAYKLLVPNDELVNKYSFLSGSVREKLKSNSEETKKLIELRDWLLPMLMNGQVTVKGTHHCTKGKLKRGSTIL